MLEKLQRSGEVPPQKLQALQRVLQSEFCNAVREVSYTADRNTLKFGFRNIVENKLVPDIAADTSNPDT